MAQAVSLLAQARQVAIFGIGASGILAEYTARLFSRMGLPASNQLFGKAYPGAVERHGGGPPPAE